MKNSNLVKFSLTLLSASVLAACSSGGGAPVVNQPAPAPNTGSTENKPTLVVDKAVNVGGKTVKKTNSDLDIANTLGNVVNSSSQGTATRMTVRLEPTLDTFVVATVKKGTDDKYTAIYLEDFDFRGNTDNTTGEYKLQHIERTLDGKTLTGSVARIDGNEKTKTGLKGTGEGTVLVYKKDLKNYVLRSENRLEANPLNAPVVGNAIDKNTVAEVYGHRTFVEGDSEKGTDVAVKDLANLPLVDAKLSHVQYGRVTSKLNGLPKDASEGLRKGIDIAGKNTYIASYGGFGENGTENSYFYKGVNPTSEVMNVTGDALIGKLKENYKAGSINYKGHAVTYGFNHAYTPDTGVVPNSVSTEIYKLESGTHVVAQINLADYTVNGRLYDVYKNGDNAVEHKLATFSGYVGSLGNIRGTATNVDRSANNGQTGILTGGLFGSQAAEFGGVIASEAKTEANSWGASFGAVAVPEAVTVESGIIVSTDENAQSE